MKNLRKIFVLLLTCAANENRGPVHLNFPFEKPLEPNSYTDEIEENIISKSLPLNTSNERKSNDIRIRKNDFEKIIGLLKRNSSVLITVGLGKF
ncbi:MAG: hypothetical protein MZV64_69115 [Ignavibacteriales bacterium]|nr:hypothetical protein [Ignavibacteriales bacterium]